MGHENANDEEKVEIKEVYVLKGKPTDLKSVESFLWNRGWALKSFTDTRSMIAELIKTKPAFVLLNADHPSPKTRQLYAWIETSLKVSAILFAESMGSQAQSFLREANFRYVLYPPVSGPAIARMFSRIEREREESVEKDAEFTLRSQRRESDNNDVISISGSKQADESSSKDGSYSRGTGDVSIFDRAGVGKLMSEIEEGNPGRSGQSVVQKAPSSVGSGRIDKQVIRGDKDTDSSQSLLLSATEHALDALSTGLETPVLQRVTMCRQVACFLLKNAELQGYLIVAFGADRKIDKLFAEEIRKHIASYFSYRNQDIQIPEHSDLKLREVPFESWSMLEAEFLRKTVHEGSEVALAYFPMNLDESPLEISADEKMIVLDLNELVEDQEVSFDIYLHLPKNQKYVRYVANERTLLSSQKDRLQSGGVTKVYVQKEAASGISKYRLCNFLNEQIAAYAQKKSG